MNRRDVREVRAALVAELPDGTAERLAAEWIKRRRAAGSPWAAEYAPQPGEPQRLEAVDAWDTAYRELLHEAWALCLKHWDTKHERVHVVRVLGDLTDWATLRGAAALGSPDGDGLGLRDEVREARDRAFRDVVPDEHAPKEPRKPYVRKGKACRRRPSKQTFEEQLEAAVVVATAHARARYGRELRESELDELRAYVAGARQEDFEEADGAMSAPDEYLDEPASEDD